MKKVYELNQEDIRMAVAEYIAKKDGKKTGEYTVDFKIHQADNDPRCHTPAHVTARVARKSENNKGPLP